MLTRSASLGEIDVDAIAVKPAEVDLDIITDWSPMMLVIDFEGMEHLPTLSSIRAIAAVHETVLTAPVRADGFDPCGDDHLLSELQDHVSFAFVAGHPGYLRPHEQARAIAPRLRVALDRFGDGMVGTEGIERIALATGATQYELLSPRTHRTIRSLRHAGFAGDIAVYAPTVRSDDEDILLDTLGAYVARRGAVANGLSPAAKTDRTASGETRVRLLDAIGEYALIGTNETINDDIRRLKSVGVDTVVCYPAAGLSSLD